MIYRQVSVSVQFALLAAPLVGVALHADAVSAQESLPSWTGFYLGAVGGYVRNDPDVDAPFTPLIDPGPNDGFTVGGQGGAGIQFGPAYLGIEADLNYADIEARGSVSTNDGGFPLATITNEEFHSRLDWFGTARARAGFALNDRILFYGTGGLAFGEVETDYIRDVSYLGVTNYAGSDSSLKAGWTAGGGVNLALTPAWMLSGEYLHIDLEDSDVEVNQVGVVAPPLGTLSSSNEFDVVRFGVKHGF